MVTSASATLRGVARVLEAARRYVARGWKPVPVPIRKKKPVLGKWQDLRLDEHTVEDHFQAPSNIGLLLGEPSGDLVDVDIDSPQALAAADTFLPATGLVHGRQSKPRSHRYYVASGTRTQKFEYADGKKKTMLIELRSTGSQTLLPPSVHPSGELVTWEDDAMPTITDVATLRRQVAFVATTALLAGSWPAEGVRHDLSLALAGLLLRLGVSEADAELVISVAARIAGDAEWSNRGSAARYTAARLSGSGAATGAPTVEDLLDGDGSKLVATIKRWVQDTCTVSACPSKAEPGQPEIDAGDLNLPIISTAAFDALQIRNRPPFVFRFGNQIIRSQDGDRGELVLQPVGKDELRHELARSALWFKLGKDGSKKRALPPTHVVSDLLASPALRFPVLHRVVETPVFTAEGVLHSDPGYDPASGLLYRPHAGFRMPRVAAVPSATEIQEAARLIRHEVLGDFPFAEDADSAHAIAGLLLPFVRNFITGATPLHIIEKPAPGMGAGLLVDVLARIATGRPAPVMSEGRQEEELRKRITSSLMGSPALIVIDNVRARLSSAALAAVLTAPTWSDRVLGKSVQIALPVRCTWFATGNNVALSDEIARRTVRIRMDAGIDRPWMRKGFRHPNLTGFVEQNRGRLVWAALTLGQAWLVAGRPGGSQSLGSYESWASVVGGVLEIARIPGFLQNLQALDAEADEQSEAWRAFIQAWWNRYADRAVGVADVWCIAYPSTSAPLDLGLGQGAEHALKTRLGRRLREHRDRLFGDLRLVGGGVSHGAQMWRVLPVKASGAGSTNVSTAMPDPQPLSDIADVLDGWAVDAFNTPTSVASSANPPNLPANRAHAEQPGEPGEVGEVQAGLLTQRGVFGQAADQPGHLQSASASVVASSSAAPSKVGFPFPTEVVRRLREMGYSDTEIRVMPLESSLELLVKAGCTSLADA